MATAINCSFTSDYSWDPSYCWSLGNSVGASNQTSYSHYFNGSDGEYHSMATTEFDRCLPGSTTCDMTYAAASCPKSHTGVSTRIDSGGTTAYCCPSAQILFTMIESTFSSLSAKYSTESSHLDWDYSTTLMPLCMYSWRDDWYKTPTTAPIVQPTTDPGDGIDVHILAIRAFAVAYNTTSTAFSIPNSAAPLPTLSPTSIPATSATPQLPSSNTSHGPRKIAISIDAGIGGFAFLGFIAALFYLFRWHQRRRPQDPNDDRDEETTTDKPELPGESLQKHKIAQEVVGEPVFEMPDTSAPVELDEGTVTTIDTDKEIKMEASRREIQSGHGTSNNEHGEKDLDEKSRM